MLVQLDYTDSRPIYEQIKDGIKKLILMNVLMPDEKLQSVRSLAMDLSTNPNTVQRAYSDLEREGYIYTVPGKGNFVRKNVNLKSEKARELRTEIEDILKQADELGIDRYELLRGL